MKVRLDISVILVVVTTLFSSGCSSIDSVVRSVEKKLGNKQSEIDTEMVTEAKEAYQSGNILLAEERYKEFVERNQRAEDKPTLSFAYSQLGRIAHEKSDFKASNRYFEKAIEIDPENLDTRGMYGESLYWQKEYVRAEALFKQALLVAPNDTRFQIMLGRTLAQQKQYIVGQRYLKQALGEQGAYEEMAIIYNNHHEYEMATMALNKARDSRNRQRQMAAISTQGNTFGARQGVVAEGASSPPVGQPVNMMNVSPSPGVAQPLSYPPSFSLGQTVPMQQAYSQVAMQGQQITQQQIVRQPQSIVIQQQSSMRNDQVQQQPSPQFSLPQHQPVVSANPVYPQHTVQQNYVRGYPMTVQQVPYSGIYQPQQALPQQSYENYPQWPQDNRSPYGFAVAEQPPVAYNPLTEPQMVPDLYGQNAQNGQEIAYYTAHTATQQAVQQPLGLPQTSMPSHGMSTPINPLADGNVSARQAPIQPQANSSMPTTGWQNNQSQVPVFSGF